MKKTLNVSFENTRITAGIKTIALMFAFVVCFLGYSSDATAQTFNTNPNTGATNGAIAQVDLKVVKDYPFSQDATASATLLRDEALLLANNPVTDGILGEATYASKVYFLDDVIQRIGDGTEVSTSFLEAYQNLASYTERTFSIGIDVEGIFRTYAGLVN